MPAKTETPVTQPVLQSVVEHVMRALGERTGKLLAEQREHFHAELATRDVQIAALTTQLASLQNQVSLLAAAQRE